MNPTPRRVPRPRAAPVDTACFADALNAAYLAFSGDVSYAVAMARAAVTIVRKRAVWQARRDTRQAEATARVLCESAGSFHCSVEDPCGTGGCKFAVGEMALVQVPECAGPTRRPQQRSRGTYSIEAAVKPLIDLRTIAPR
jgi:hypothetical protein